MADGSDSRRLAVLIDADNTSARYAAAIFDEIASLGEANVRRIYGDFSSTRLGSWDSAVQSLAILQHQQRSNTTGKNAADIALVIDAMDLLYKRTLDGFCLVSSDSDFTRLAEFIPEGALLVFNDTKVIPARLYAKKPTGGVVEILCTEIDEKKSECRALANKRLEKGDVLSIEDTSITVLDTEGSGYHFAFSTPIMQLIEKEGTTPIPPYLNGMPAAPGSPSSLRCVPDFSGGQRCR